MDRVARESIEKGGDPLRSLEADGIKSRKPDRWTLKMLFSTP